MFSGAASFAFGTPSFFHSPKCFKNAFTTIISILPAICIIWSMEAIAFSVYPCTSSFRKGSMRLRYSQLISRFKTSSEVSSFSGTESEVTVSLKKIMFGQVRQKVHQYCIIHAVALNKLTTSGVAIKRTGVTAWEIVLAYLLFKYSFKCSNHILILSEGDDMKNIY